MQISFVFISGKKLPGDNIHQWIGDTVQKSITNIIMEVMSGMLPFRQEQFDAGEKFYDRRIGIVGQIMGNFRNRR
jgi:hypothetical protein